jgi:hypothetical protein
MYQVLGQMLRTAEINMAESVTPNDVDVFLHNAAWAICSTYHTVLKASPGAAVFGQEMLFNILFLADWHKIGEHMQSLAISARLIDALITITRLEIKYLL